MHIRLFFTKIFNWEFWPFHVVYFPLFFYWLWSSLKARSFFYFSAANPSIETGGMSGESKFDVLSKIPKKFIPATILVKAPASISQIRLLMENASLRFPIIVKPDIGERGTLVEKIVNEGQLCEYVKKMKVNFLIQEFINFEVELGVFYYRHPDWTKGVVSSIVQKDFLKVTGDGSSTILELMARYPRAAFQLKRLKNKNGELMNAIPAKIEVVELEPIGNHCRGTIFLNGNYLIDHKVNEVFDRISKSIDGFYYGRYDLRCKSLEDLKRGENIKIVELNGVGAEPAHIYQPGYSLLKGYRVLFAHWKQMYLISRKNHRLGHPYMTFKEGIKKLVWIRSYHRMLK